MIDFSDLVPLQLRRILDRYQPRTFGELAAAHGVEPVTVAAILRGALFVRRQSNYTFDPADSLHFDQPKLTRVSIEAGDVITEILLVNVGDFPTLRSFVLDRDAHR